MKIILILKMSGPSVFKIDSTYYMLYSANNFKSSNYAVGYATSSSPLGPWNKSKKSFNKF